MRSVARLLTSGALQFLPAAGWILFIFTAALPCGLRLAAAPPSYVKMNTWQETLLASRASFQGRRGGQKEEDGGPGKLWDRIERDFPIQWDWVLQDHGRGFERWFQESGRPDLEEAMIRRVLKELGPAGEPLEAELEALSRSGGSPGDRRWLDLYVKACEVRRRIRLEPLLSSCRRIAFTKHFNLGGSHYAYTEGQSDAQAERQFEPGTSLCVLEQDGLYGTVRNLIDDPQGVIRDPDVSYDGKRILFAWKKSDREDDYHIYEMEVESGKIRQLTSGLGFADYEGVYLPSGDILFNSTRCVQTVDCWWTEVSNLYTCNADGKYLRRLTVDQVHTNYPTVTEDGRVLYTRWEYIDRGQIYPQPLYQMNPDGTGQTEFYGNNSWFPTTILHARGIPGTAKVLGILAGHHTRQTGKLAIIDPAAGNLENSGVTEIAPVKETPAVRIDAYGQNGELFQYPYPLSETEYLVSYDPFGWPRKPLRFEIYFMTIDGRRELLAADPNISCNQPIPLRPRPLPHRRPSLVDYRKETGTFYVQDVHAGAGLAGVPRGTIQRIRVVALEHRAAGVRSNRNNGPAGGALISTPISVGNGAWDVKIVLGEAEVYDDGSACFTVPARTPVYFQALNAKGHAVQTMRSWSTLQPGESYSCVGCHETKTEVPPARPKITMAMKAGPKPLKPFYGPPRGFSFVREIQPIIDRHCVSCHDDRSKELVATRARRDEPPADRQNAEKAFSLLGAQTAEQKSGRRWSDAYIALTQARGDPCSGQPNRLVNWISAQSVPTMLPPYHAGAAKSELLPLLESGHGEVKLSREELEKIACWIDLLVPYCGDYTEANTWSEGEVEKYAHFLGKRRCMEEIERKNIQDLIRDRGQ